jgi:hypothetical protein
VNELRRDTSWSPLLAAIPLGLLTSSWADALLIFGTFVLQAAMLMGVRLLAKRFVDAVSLNIIGLVALGTVTAWVDLLMQAFPSPLYSMPRAYLPVVALCAGAFSTLQLRVHASLPSTIAQLLMTGVVLAGIELIRMAIDSRILLTPPALLFIAGALLAAVTHRNQRRLQQHPSNAVAKAATSATTRRVRVTGPVS